MNWFFITLGYSGLLTKAPGTVGSFVALILGVVLLAYGGSQTLFLASILVTLIAIKSINKYEQKTNTHDDKRIVIDELAGMWIALSIAPGVTMPLEHIDDLKNGFLIQSILSFLLFRYFDITKPSIIGRIDKKVKGGIGVMGDDVIAGFAAGILTAAIWQLFVVKFIL